MTRFGLLTILFFLVVTPLAPVSAQDLLWVRQAGTFKDERALGVAVDGAGNAYLAGRTRSSLGGPNAGLSDAFLAKYDASGILLWTRQTGTATDDSASGVAVDGAGNAYIAGSTQGGLGGPNAGLSDAFIAKYDAAGTLLWMRQFGTSSLDSATSVAVDSVGDAYITGQSTGSLGGPHAGSWDAFLAKYDAAGTLLWMRQIGTEAEELCRSVAVDGAGNAYITGRTKGSLDGIHHDGFFGDAFLVKFDASGTPLWTRQVGTTANELGYGVAVDGAGNAYITGYTGGSLGGPMLGGYDVYLFKYDAWGILLWSRQAGTSNYDEGYGVVVDGAGNAYITGYTEGSFGGSHAGEIDAFLASYNASGTLLWTRQLGSAAYDLGFGVTVDGAGNTYLAGVTFGNLGGSSEGGDDDYFLAKYGPPPCPADFNQDGFVNGDDFDSFSLVFINGDAAADFDGNGFVNGDDFDGYVAAFVGGC